MKNKCLSLLLCAALVFTMMATPAVQPPAHAEAAALFTVDGIAIALVILAACGITFSSTSVGRKCIEQWGVDVPEVPELVSFLLAQTKEGHILTITALALPKVKQLVKDAFDYFKDKISMTVQDTDFGTYGDVKFTTLSSFPSDQFVFEKCCYLNYGYSIYINANGQSNYYNTSTCLSNNGEVVESVYLLFHDSAASYVKDGSTFRYQYKYSDCLDFNKFSGFKWGFRKITIDNTDYLSPICAYKYLDSTGKAHYGSCTEIASAGYGLIAIPADGVAYDQQEYGILSNILDGVDDINEAISHAVGSLNEGIQADIQKVIDAVNQASATDTAITRDEAQELLGIKEYIEALEAAQERTIEAIKEGTKEDDMKTPQLPAQITNKFPFCVPFDLIALVKTFNATPEAPKVTVPVVFQSMHYSHDFVFDFSGDDWDKVAAVSRWGILLFFMLGLTLVTRKLIKG